jgi:hypothetical protein
MSVNTNSIFYKVGQTTATKISNEISTALSSFNNDLLADDNLFTGINTFSNTTKLGSVGTLIYTAASAVTFKISGIDSTASYTSFQVASSGSGTGGSISAISDSGSGAFLVTVDNDVTVASLITAINAYELNSGTKTFFAKMVSGSDSTVINTFNVIDFAKETQVYAYSDVSFEGDLSVAGNTTISGDLTVAGTTTTISSEDLKVADTLIRVADGTSLSNAITYSDKGILFERGSSQLNSIIYWDESASEFVIGLVEETGGVETYDFTSNNTNYNVSENLGSAQTDPNFEIQEGDFLLLNNDTEGGAPLKVVLGTTKSDDYLIGDKTIDGSTSETKITVPKLVQSTTVTIDSATYSNSSVIEGDGSKTLATLVSEFNAANSSGYAITGDGTQIPAKGEQISIEPDGSGSTFTGTFSLHQVLTYYSESFNNGTHTGTFTIIVAAPTAEGANSLNIISTAAPLRVSDISITDDSLGQLELGDFSDFESGLNA